MLFVFYRMMRRAVEDSFGHFLPDAHTKSSQLSSDANAYSESEAHAKLKRNATGLIVDESERAEFHSFEGPAGLESTVPSNHSVSCGEPLNVDNLDHTGWTRLSLSGQQLTYGDIVYSHDESEPGKVIGFMGRGSRSFPLRLADSPTGEKRMVIRRITQIKDAWRNA
jgi:hypothetical protein